MLSQIIAVTGVNLRTIRAAARLVGRRRSSASPASSSCSSAVLSIAEGFRSAMTGVGDPQTVIVMRAGQRHRDDERPRRRRSARSSGRAGHRARRAERPARLAGAVRHRRPSARSDPGTDANVPLRGVTPHALEVRARGEDRRGPDVRAGHERDHRRPRRVAAVRGPDVGTSVRWGENTWKVVGIFEARRQRRRVRDLVRRAGAAAAYRRGNSLPVGLSRGSTSADRFQTFKDSLTTEPAAEGHRRSASRTTTRSSRRRCRRSSARSASSSPG